MYRIDKQQGPTEQHRELYSVSCDRASLVVQWLRICLPMQGTRVQALVREDPTCTEQLSPCATTTEPVLWSPQATTTEAHVPRARAPQQEKPLQ